MCRQRRCFGAHFGVGASDVQLLLLRVPRPLDNWPRVELAGDVVRVQAYMVLAVVGVLCAAPCLCLPCTTLTLALARVDASVRVGPALLIFVSYYFVTNQESVTRRGTRCAGGAQERDR